METYQIPAIQDKIQISAEALNQLSTHAEEGFPNEICGFFYGKNGDIREITRVRPVINAKAGDQRRRFEISPIDYMKAEQMALEKDMDLLGIYHSHPNHPAIPSVHDLSSAVPVFSYIILSVQDGKLDHIRSWRLDENSGKFFEEIIL